MLFGRTSANNPSRFVEEIPSEFLERKAALRNDSFATRPEVSSYSASTKKSYLNERPKYSTPLPPKPEVSHNFKVGDAVFHSAFKDGVIIKLTPMGGDSLIEIEFESGVKRLMLKAAAEHMKKK